MKKHIGIGIDAGRLHRTRPTDIGLMDLPRRQSNAREPENFIADLQRDPVGQLIFTLQAGLADKSGLVGGSARFIHLLLQTNRG